MDKTTIRSIEELASSKNWAPFLTTAKFVGWEDGTDIECTTW
jgi:hypothetical protein